MTYNAILKQLGTEAQTYLSEAVGDLNDYIKNAIEATVNISKPTQG